MGLSFLWQRQEIPMMKIRFELFLKNHWIPSILAIYIIMYLMFIFFSFSYSGMSLVTCLCYLKVRPFLPLLFHQVTQNNWKLSVSTKDREGVFVALSWHIQSKKECTSCTWDKAEPFLKFSALKLNSAGKYRSPIPLWNWDSCGQWALLPTRHRPKEKDRLWISCHNGHHWNEAHRAIKLVKGAPM